MSAWHLQKKIALDHCLLELGFSRRETELALLAIIGRMVHPGSERQTRRWAQTMNGLAELIPANFQRLSLNSLYTIADQLYEHQSQLENHLRKTECDLFSLKEQIILYDLTNTFFEGRALANPKAQFGRSREKRSDCRLLTLGLVIDDKGYPKVSRVFAGNHSEPKTLVEMVTALRELLGKTQPPLSLEPVTIVVDAGLATEKNLAELRSQGYHYVCVSRKKLTPAPTTDELLSLQAKQGHQIQVKRLNRDGEVYLYCLSKPKQQKEQAMHHRWQELFEQQLTHLSQTIHQKGCTKNYQKVCERIGRLRQKYSRLARYYTITVIEKNGLADEIQWQYAKPDQANAQFSGSYYLRTDRTDLTEQQIWDIYIMLKELEASFRAMKSEIGLRPNFHQTEQRSEAHIFITVIAYHLVNAIRNILQQNGISLRWENIRLLLSTHTIGTMKLITATGKTIQLRKCSEPEYFHRTIYDALKLSYIPCKAKKLEA